jgi:tRNA-dihydrouridine synthase
VIPERPTAQEVCDMMLRHARMQIAYKGDYVGIREMRKHISWYTAGYPGSAKLRGAINQVETYEELEELLMTRWDCTSHPVHAQTEQPDV